VEKIVQSLGLKILPRDLKSKDTRALLQSIFMQWIPLSKAVLVSVVEQLPAPPEAQLQRMPHIIESTPGNEAVSAIVKNTIINFNTDQDAPVIAYVSKMVAIPESELRKVRRVQMTAEEMREMGRQKQTELVRQLATEAANSDKGENKTEIREDPLNALNKNPSDELGKDRLIGFARLYSGAVKVGQELYVLGPKYSPLQPHLHVSKVTVTDLYYIMGKDLEPLEEVPAGNVFGIAGLEGKILKNGTLCSVESGGLNLAGINLGPAPIVRVALEPKNPSQMNKMIEGLKLLEQADPCVEYKVQDNGEHVILTAGELHLEVIINENIYPPAKEDDN
jgi:ribosome assembly protein 1